MQGRIDESGPKDRSNPRALINLVSTALESAIAAIPDNMLAMPEDELRKRVNPNTTDELLRMSFWNEYNSAQARGKKMDITNVYAQFCSRQYFHKEVVGNSWTLAWLMTPPPNYQIAMETILSLSLTRMVEITKLPLEQPILAKDGSVHYAVNPKVGELIVKTYQEAVQRVKGAIVQKNMNLNVTTSAPEIQETPQDLDEEIRKLESNLKLQGSASREEPIDVTPLKESDVE